MSVCEDKIYQDVYTEYSEQLRNFMYYKTGDLSQAEDLMHEAFIKLWQNCAKVLREKSKSYIFTVANNLFINVVRHKKIVLEFEKTASDATNIEDPVFALQHKEFQNKLEEAIGSLTEAQREVFLMSRIDKLKYDEIASLLGISVKAVEKRIHKAMQNLKASVEELKERKI